VPDAAVDVLIVGAGPAGVACADELRNRGFDGSIMLVGRESDPPYERPAVSKEYLRGGMSREEALLRPADHWQRRGIELLTRVSAMRLDPEAHAVRLSDKRELTYGKLLLATGANVRRLRVDGAQLDGIHHLRALGNADALRADIEAAERVVLVGGSYVACEVAASLTAMGKACAMVMAEDLPLSTGFGTQAGEFFARLLREHEIELVCGDALEGFKAAPGARGDARPRVETVVTASGREVPADVVVMGTGAVPDVMLARAAGLALGETGGIACTAALETSAPEVWAAGDVCEYESRLHGRRLRIEHWEVAAAQGRAVAASMLGVGRDFDEVPYFWSDLADWAKLEYVGAAARWDVEVVRGSLDDGSFTIFYLDAGRVAAALTVGREDDLVHAARLLYTGADVGTRTDALADPDVPLGSL
jgi:3-phenylpropionate/trans-cinnamate dioxygenase ferredoxin reductase subunit